MLCVGALCRFVLAVEFAGEAGEEAPAAALASPPPSAAAAVGGRMCMRRNYRAGVVRSHYSSIQLTVVTRHDASLQRNSTKFLYNIFFIFILYNILCNSFLTVLSLSIGTLPRFFSCRFF